MADFVLSTDSLSLALPATTTSGIALPLVNVSATSASAVSPVAVSVDPLVFFAILDHYNRRDSKQYRVVGVLLGVRSEDGSDYEVRNCFPVAYSETDDDQVTVDAEYVHTMYVLHQRVNPKEQIVGWYATGTEESINQASVFLHEFFSTEFMPPASYLPFNPVHLLVDSALTNDRVGVKAFVSSPVGVPGTEHPGSMFIQVPCNVRYFDAERSGLDVIASAKSGPASLLSDMDQLERSILEVRSMVERVSTYVSEVREGTREPDSAIGRYLFETVSSLPMLWSSSAESGEGQTQEDGESAGPSTGSGMAEFERRFTNQLQDLLMVVYLANLTRTQLSIAERLQRL
ncbi:JAB1/Mov34/MPN/PAD-1 ubiquitin protease-domain-containing protein [Cladochytrium replicatum]|nr:JAB1/Mov34/MPN/PAD-1 ubiquitin protease-domain-containing protein [Cladochytrium replicatum]